MELRGGIAKGIFVVDEFLHPVALAVAELNLVASRRFVHVNNTQIIDIRDIRELWREGRIPGALHCPRGMNEFWIDPQSPYHKPIYASGKRFVLYCAGAWRSALEAKMFQEMGLTNVAHMAGGFTAWKAAGMPVETVERKS